MQLMSDDRHEHLVKAAEECVDLLNLGSDPNAALRHVKRSFELNDKEVVLVSHAVNNSKQLAHLQSSDSKDKSSPFPLTDADAVVGANSKADLDTPVDKPEQPDAVEIAERVKKEAVARTWENKDSYRFLGFDKVAALDELKTAWAVTSAPTPQDNDGNPYDAVSHLKIAADEARTEAVRLRDAAYASLEKIASAFLVGGAPSFAVFEKAATALNITPEVIELVYEMGPEAIGVARNQEKYAGERMYVEPRIDALLKSAQAADEMWQQSANYEAARTHLLGQIRDEETKIAADAKDFLEPVTKADDFAGSMLPSLDPKSVESVTNVPTETKDVDVDYKTQQQLQNSKARARIQALMQDDYVGKQSLPEVVESYNRAMSVNPDFGDAEIMAFIRQDLASKGAVPLDLMVRSSQSHKANTKA